MASGEMPIELGNSWFSAKFILVKCLIFIFEVELFFRAGINKIY